MTAILVLAMVNNIVATDSLAIHTFIHMRMNITMILLLLLLQWVIITIITIMFILMNSMYMVFPILK
ncbi:hypothetical protein HMPREF3203_02562 [Proteus mirabilis]|nr:hypothetical protein HMPREF3203_02562 [Proteus mirabilis]